MKSPAITVIVPVYNQEHLLKRCVNSILNQDYTDFELILKTMEVPIAQVRFAMNMHLKILEYE